jgi:hypothetical protein
MVLDTSAGSTTHEEQTWLGSNSKPKSKTYNNGGHQPTLTLPRQDLSGHTAFFA